MTATEPMTIYPKTMVLGDGTHAQLRPLEPEDKVQLAEFFHNIPEEERYYLRDDVASPEVIREWTSNMDFRRVIPIVATVELRIVADGTLHRDPNPARRHIGNIRVVVDPEFRTKGLGGRIIRELVDLAMAEGLVKVLFEVVDRREQPALEAAKAMGFSELAVIQGAIKDHGGNYQDIVVLELPLDERNMWWRF